MKASLKLTDKGSEILGKFIHRHLWSLPGRKRSCWINGVLQVKLTTLTSYRSCFCWRSFNCLPDHVAMYLNERKVSSRSAAAVLADKFVLTHKNVYKPTKVEPPLLAD